jgi:hypothetical protein
MTQAMHRKPSLLRLALAASALTVAVPAAAAVDPFDGAWHFSLTPYLWVPNINANMNAPVSGLRDPNGTALATATLSTEIGPNDYLENLQFGLMLTGEARKGAWSVITDVIYIDFGNQGTHTRNLTGPAGRPLTTIDRQTEAGLSTTVWTLAGAYTVARAPTWNFDVLAGFRYLAMDADLKWDLQGSRDILATSGRVSQDSTLWDGIVGVKGQVRLGDGRWFMPYYADIGTGDSNWTWQALLGLGYTFGWGDVNLSIRSLSYDFDKNDTDLRMTGPVLGASFRW